MLEGSIPVICLKKFTFRERLRYDKLRRGIDLPNTQI